MLAWKIFAFVSAAVSAGYWLALLQGKQPFDRWDQAGVAVQSVALFGLFTYAFTLPIGGEPFWAVFQVVFAAACLLGIWRDLDKFRPDPEVLIGAAIYTPLVVFEWLALYRIGGSPFGEIRIF